MTLLNPGPRMPGHMGPGIAHGPHEDPHVPWTPARTGRAIVPVEPTGT